MFLSTLRSNSAYSSQPRLLLEVRVQSDVPAALAPNKQHGSHFIGSWFGFRAGLNRFEEEKTSYVCRDLNPRFSIRSWPLNGLHCHQQ